MKIVGMPLTRANYIRMNWPGIDPLTLDGESLSDIPSELAEE
jgi:hypothetical protein